MKRLALLTALVLVCAPVRASATPVVKPTLFGTAGDNGWYRSKVTVNWAVSDDEGKAIIAEDPSGCAPVTLTADTQGTALSCKATNSDGVSVFFPLSLRVDQTPPVLGPPAPNRPPDAGGWFNRPVGIAWSGSDATSGIAGCTSTTYAGPDDAAAAVSGTCTDRAGNVSAPRSTTLAYDATAPALDGVSATPAEAAVQLRWTASPDAVSVRVERSPGRAGAASSPVYEGTGNGVDDEGLQGNTRYTYTLTAVDAAGNARTATASAVPTGTLLAPAPGANVAHPPRLRWRFIKGARYYNVQLFRGKRKILSAWPTTPHLQLRSTWTYRGRRQRLAPGRYRWYVWPGYGPRHHHRYGKLLGRRTFTQR